MDRSRHPTERANFQELFQRQFSDLGDVYEVIEPGTGRYNCIAHSLGLDDEWVNPQTGPKNAPLAAMDRIYEEVGYTRSSTIDFCSEPDTQKVVLYAIAAADGTVKSVTHAAIQDQFGSWESKLGCGPLLRHPTPDALNGSRYGKPVAVYIRTQ